MFLSKFKRLLRSFFNQKVKNNFVILNSKDTTGYSVRKIMQNNSNLLKPPDHVFGLTALDKSLFEKTITVPCLKVRDVKISSLMPIVKKYLLKLEHFKPVTSLSDSETLIYLNPERVTGWQDFDLQDREALQQLNLNENNIENKSHTLLYENFSVEAIFKSVLPKDVEGTSSYTRVGHIVHVNFREHLLPFKKLIGQVLYEKVPGCRTVVNKTDNIDNTYRNFKMEVLQGEDCMLTRVKANKCLFEFDFSKVYWNSRLCTEHERVVKMVNEGDVFFDVFAGVGPFSVPVAKKGGLVFANDLNPESFKWLEHNCNINKIDRGRFKAFNKDGKEFIKDDVKQLLPQFLVDKRKIYICMNLPALAMEFLPHFINLYEDLDELQEPPVVIVYCFTKGEDCVNLAKELLFKNIGCDISDKIIDIFRVRTVSSLKEMMRVTVKLDRDILIGNILKNQSTKRKIVDCDVDAKRCNYGEKQTKEDE